MTTRQDLLELREELQEASRTAKENLEPRLTDQEEHRITQVSSPWSLHVLASQLGT